MALLCRETETFSDESLEEWKSVASGGFGNVFKARHKDWGFDVAIKILRDGVCFVMPKEKALYEEANHMEKASCEFVLRVYGIYQGCPPPLRGTDMQRGIVMEFMGGGCVQSLLTRLSGPPPYSLAFRLAHQVALGMNFLHSRELMHHDLKPSNVLLTDDLNAKEQYKDETVCSAVIGAESQKGRDLGRIADFGLSRVSTSALSSNRETTTKIGGSYKYMPPEAFEISYNPVRAFDIYSYGILLWSVVTGKEPYGRAQYSLVELRIREGDRPDCKDIDETRADGLKEMVDLMRKCWDGDPTNRPKFKECLKVTENVFSKHKKGIHHAVDEVLRRLDSLDSNQHSERSMVSSRPPQTPEQSKPCDIVDHGRFTETQRSSVQDSASVPTKRMSDKDKAKFVDDNMAVLIQSVSEVMAIAEALGGMVHRETYERIAVTATNQGKMRLLYRKTFPPGGVKVKAAFYDALREHHAELLERLSG